MYELIDEELTTSAGSKQTITIKFERVYKPSIKINKIVFGDIVLDADSYQAEKQSQRAILEINI